MTRILLACMLLVCVASAASAITEREVAATLAQRLQQALGERRNLSAVQELRLTAALTLAGDQRALALAIARQQLAAELAAAGAGTIGAAPELKPAQLRSQYVKDTNAAIQTFVQAYNAAQQAWSKQVTDAHTRLQRDEAASLSALQKNLSTIQQEAQAKVNSIPGEVPPEVAPGLLDLTGEAKTGEIVAGANKAMDQVRAKYHEDVGKLLAQGYAELKAAVAITAPAERTLAIRKAIGKLQLLSTDRFDQYDSETRAALSKALLQAVQ